MQKLHQLEKVCQYGHVEKIVRQLKLEVVLNDDMSMFIHYFLATCVTVVVYYVVNKTYQVCNCTSINKECHDNVEDIPERLLFEALYDDIGVNDQDD